MTVFGDRVLACTLGHLYIANRRRRLFNSINLGAVRLMYCPMCHKMRMAMNVDASALSEAELEEARRR